MQLRLKKINQWGIIAERPDSVIVCEGQHSGCGGESTSWLWELTEMCGILSLLLNSCLKGNVIYLLQTCFLICIMEIAFLPWIITVKNKDSIYMRLPCRLGYIKIVIFAWKRFRCSSRYEVHKSRYNHHHYQHGQ